MLTSYISRTIIPEIITDTGRLTSSTSEYPEWFLTAFAVAEPEIFALASTGNISARFRVVYMKNKKLNIFSDIRFMFFVETSPSENDPTTNPPFYEPRIPTNTNVISASVGILDESSFLSIDKYRSGKYIFLGYFAITCICVILGKSQK